MTPVQRVGALLAVATLVLAGCKVDARVDVTLRSDGSGTLTARVVLDADAVSRLTADAPLARAVPLGDLRAAGWTVSPWTPVRGGGDAVSITRGFIGAHDLASELADLVGASGVLRDPRITHTRSFFGANDGLSISVDLRDVQAGVRSDAQLSQRLRAAGVDVGALDAQLRSQLGHALTLTVDVHAPGGHSRTVQLTAGGHAVVSASRSQLYARRIVLVGVGGLLLLVALALTAGSLATRSRRRRTS